MPFIITDPCIETKDSACVDVCPVDCINPRKDEPEFAQATMLYIHPEECIDCGACVPACPVAAIYESIDATPSHQKDLVEVPEDVRADIEFVLVDTMDQVLEHALDRSTPTTAQTGEGESKATYAH